ncbi:C-di-GMP-specific phosphodiesterase [Levilactobacillus namurensis DSM 19117]|uniref:C-di-GMP-specific phosphodiesterase n=1 Tax=Levilactobacillus namurensis DSM 19117 TaxID=1423773 RepID=A0A0R1K0V8_9LACO|nr:EAL domain-containing protein [Levilactobacillus namurensis]KRK76744.1 C-di-GMP-specific phosphodiesterase [Levilactobacillus namurensis DSM 19117]GEO73829.1 diguanylate cyclase [Levilactobacillus namurensis]HJE45368.1 EAL domain-containing protein [Levilactobacillus namurensis]
MYRYFLQPQLDASNNSLIGYELLIRQQVAGKWVLPHDFASIPIDVQADLIRRTAQKIILKVGSVSFNTNQSQFIDPTIAQAILSAQKQIYPMNLVLEVTEEVTDQHVTNQQIIDQVHYFDEHGIQLSLDDIGTGINTYDHIKPILPYASEIKFAMQNFRQEGRAAEIPDALAFWKQVADQHRLRLILEGVENQAEHDMANDLGIDYRQGWFYGKPHLLKLDGD